MKELKHLVRPNILALTPYSSARDEYKDTGEGIFLDANESPFNRPENRYPDPLQTEVKKKIAEVKGVAPEQIFLGNGSDEAIDLVYRVFCTPQRDNVLSLSPTYGMYEVCAHINDVEYRTLQLDEDFGFCGAALLDLANPQTKAIFLCSPNNPTGNLLPKAEVEYVLKHFDGIVVVDEAYADFSPNNTFRSSLNLYPNLIVLNTFSKAWASAGIRLGMAFAQPEIIALFNKVKYPYNVNCLTQQHALDILKRRFDVEKWVKLIVEERERMRCALMQLPFCEEVYPSDANFLLTRMHNAQAIYDYLVERHIIVRNRTQVSLCHNCLRITIGSLEENTRLLAALRQYES